MEMQEKAFSFTLSFTGHKFITFNTIQYSISAASLGLKVFILPRAINRTQRIVDNEKRIRGSEVSFSWWMLYMYSIWRADDFIAYV